jgi:hypothetical protein
MNLKTTQQEQLTTVTKAETEITITNQKTTVPLELWWCPYCHWGSQLTEDTRSTPHERPHYINYHLSSLLHGSDLNVGDKINKYYKQYVDTSGGDDRHFPM